MHKKKQSKIDTENNELNDNIDLVVKRFKIYKGIWKNACEILNHQQYIGVLCFFCMHP